MKKLALVALVTLGFFSVAGADELQRQTITVSIGTNSAVTVAATNRAIEGYIEEISVMASKGSITGNVQIVAVPVSGAPNQVLYTNSALTGAVTIRPWTYATDNTGAGLATNVAVRYALKGEDVKMIVANLCAQSNLTYTASIKFAK